MDAYDGVTLLKKVPQIKENQRARLSYIMMGRLWRGDYAKALKAWRRSGQRLDQRKKRWRCCKPCYQQLGKTPEKFYVAPLRRSGAGAEVNAYRYSGSTMILKVTQLKSIYLFCVSYSDISCGSISKLMDTISTRQEGERKKPDRHCVSALARGARCSRYRCRCRLLAQHWHCQEILPGMVDH